MIKPFKAWELMKKLLIYSCLKVMGGKRMALLT